MPPTAKRYIVEIRIPVLNAWIVITEPMTSKQAESLLGNLRVESRIREVGT